MPNYTTESPEMQEATLPNTPENEREPNIMKAEVEQVIKYLKINNSSEQDEINAEALQALGDGMDIMLEVCKKIWQTGNWSKDWTQFIFIP